MIDKKRLFKSLIIISLIIIIIITAIQIRNTLARYETVTTSERDVETAFWIVDNSFESQRLFIKDIYPSTTAFEYTFTVSNFKENNIAETDLEYDMVITTTTNLPLSYEITRQINGVTAPITMNQDLYKDSDGTVYRKLSFGTTENPYPFIMDTINDSTYTKSKITDTYTLKVTFPKSNSAYEEYADLMEDINIELSARQIVSSDNIS